uniref:Uncharacterized protein n=1 Tax=Meloidogyne enterolobii TaxID=390850 RepID=A0A6V7WUK6_MELEN|nr:unnamed protein product [Meloidogyne enterolobii]
MKSYRSNTDYNTRLDRVIKACVQDDPSRRTWKKLLNFLVVTLNILNMNSVNWNVWRINV